MVELGSEDLLVLLLASSTIFKEVRRPLSQGLLPGMDLARVDFKPAGQLCNGVLPLERGQSHFGLEDWAVLLTCLLHVLLLVCGTATITATAGSASGAAVVTVTSVEVSPSVAELTAWGETVQLTAEALDANGHAVAGDVLSWESSDALGVCPRNNVLNDIRH